MKENIQLKEYTTMRTGGEARYFFIIQNTKDLKDAVLFATEKNLPIFILGGGSNTIASDDGFRGVVLKIEITGIIFESVDENIVHVTAGAGVEWDTLVSEVVSKNLYGLENLSSIPGTVGAAPVQNIGAYGAEVKDVILYVEMFDTETMAIKKITNKECLFGYRNSFFKSDEGKKFIITGVVLELKKNGKLNIKYKDVEEYFVKQNIKPTLSSVRNAITEIRKSKLPDMKKFGIAGSFFKNPIVSKGELGVLLKAHPNINYFKINEKEFKLSAAWLLDKIGGWNGARRGDVCVHERQPIVLMNCGNANTKQILSLADEIQQDIKEKTGVSLEYEVNIIGVTEYICSSH